MSRVAWPAVAASRSAVGARRFSGSRWAAGSSRMGKAGSARGQVDEPEQDGAQRGLSSSGGRRRSPPGVRAAGPDRRGPARPARRARTGPWHHAAGRRQAFRGMRLPELQRRRGQHRDASKAARTASVITASGARPSVPRPGGQHAEQQDTPQGQPGDRGGQARAARQRGRCCRFFHVSLPADTPNYVPV
jgi:hypothetical protein